MRITYVKVHPASIIHSRTWEHLFVLLWIATLVLALWPWPVEEAAQRWEALARTVSIWAKWLLSWWEEILSVQLRNWRVTSRICLHGQHWSRKQFILDLDRRAVYLQKFFDLFRDDHVHPNLHPSAFNSFFSPLLYAHFSPFSADRRPSISNNGIISRGTCAIS
jgi:hypothetical protein